MVSITRYLPEISRKLERKMKHLTRQIIAQEIIDLVTRRGTDKTACPSEIARNLAGSDEKQWRQLMKPIREEAVKLALAGDIEIRRKGKPVHPQNFKGIYRLGLPRS